MLTKEQIKKIILDFSSESSYPNTDKGSYHAYEEFYPEIFYNFQNKEINLLEIGIAGGASLKMWQQILPQAKIYGSDGNYGYLQYSEKDLKDFILLPQGDKTDPNLYKDIPMMDIIIDDASHISTNSVKTFNILKNKLKNNGVYIIEDVWIEQIQEYPIEFLLQFTVVDLRQFKNRNDDMLLVYKKEVQ